MRRILGFFGTAYRLAKRTIRFDSPPPLRSTLFRVIFVAVLIPVLLFTWSVSTRPSVTNIQNLGSLDAALHTYQPKGTPQSDYQAMKKIIVAANVTLGTEGRFNWPPNENDLSPLSLPSSFHAQLATKGYAFGDVVFQGKGARFVAWRVPPSSFETATYRVMIKGFRGWPWTALGWFLGVLGYFAILAAIASPAAWLLERRIARPINQVAQASRVMAEGGYPLPVPPRGPAELFALVDSFNRMADKLQKAEVAERNFLLSVSHELKTPLTAIEGYAELLTDGAVRGEEAGPVLATEAGRLRRLVSDLLDLARMKQSTFAIRTEDVALGEVAQEVVRRHAAQAENLGVLLTVDSSSAGAVRGDEDRLVQAVSNLVENALRYVPRGGTVMVKATLAEVIVEDDGPGISAEDLPHAFERFYLRTRSKSDPTVGSGLGLAIVKELIEKMGGTASAKSEPGKGTAFTLSLVPVLGNSAEPPE